MDTGQLELKLSRRPASPLFARLGDDYVNSGKFAEAKELLLSGLQRYPSYTTASVVLAKCQFADRDFAGAIETAKSALSIHPDSTILQNLILRCDEALRQPASVVEVAPPEPAVIEASPQQDGPADPDFDYYSATSVITENATVETLPPDEKSEGIPAMPMEEQVGEIMTESMPLPVQHKTPEGEFGHSDSSVAVEESVPVEFVSPPEPQPIEDIVDAATPPDFELKPEPQAIVEEPFDIAPPAEIPAQVQEYVEDVLPPFMEEVHYIPDPVLEEIRPTGELAEVMKAIEEKSGDAETPLILEEPHPPPSETVPQPAVEIQIAPLSTEIIEPPAVEVRPATPVTEIQSAPAISGDNEIIAEPTDGRIVSQTLAEIYAKQGVYEEAIMTYKLLRQRRPEQRAQFDARISELRSKMQVKKEEGL